MVESLVILAATVGPVVIVVAVMAGRRVFSTRRGGRAVAALAAERGWTFREDAPELIGTVDIPPFPYYDQVSAGQVVDGHVDGRRFTSHRYVHRVPGTGETAAYNAAIGVLALSSNRSSVPAFQVEDRASAGAWSLPEGREVKVPSADFTTKRCVVTTDPELAPRLLTPAVCEFLLASPPWPWRLTGGTLVICRFDGVFSADDLRAAIPFGARLLDALEPLLADFP